MNGELAETPVDNPEFLQGVLAQAAVISPLPELSKEQTTNITGRR